MGIQSKRGGNGAESQKVPFIQMVPLEHLKAQKRVWGLRTEIRVDLWFFLESSLLDAGAGSEKHQGAT